ncbi:MAG: GTP-binding protein [Deltaproteobacteria bacterium]|nr:GTP-binding protein [Deltaproteobacteria bacterium]
MGQNQFERRRTFAIISHPDAGKTTLTEKLLLYGGAIHAAGAVKSRKAKRSAVSDWMALEKQRGISVTTSVLQFEYDDVRWNLLDTPGHNDFSEDTYRTLMAADCGIMILDAARGVEQQTRKLFHVCRMRNTPVVTFINKMDRPARDAFALMSEVEDVLGVSTVPFTWPIGSGDLFQGVYDRINKLVIRFERSAEGHSKRAEMKVTGLDDPELDALLGEEAAQTLRDEVELLDGAGEEWDEERFLAGQITPVFFGTVSPGDDRFSAFVFKVQANMDPAHRDRIAFARICSGKFEGGMRVHHFRLGKAIRLNRAEQFFAQERESVTEAFAGDIVGLYDPGLFRIGDTLSTNGPMSFDAVPLFSPEHFGRLQLLDPLKRKQLQKGIRELSEEGTVQLFMEPGREKDPVCGVVGRLQFDVLMFRLEHEYGARVTFDLLPYQHARWVEGATDCAELRAKRIPMAVLDQDNRPVALFRDEWELGRAERDNENWTFHETAPIVAVA